MRPPKEAASSAELSDAAGAAARKAIECALGDVAGGRVHAGCESRAVETALALHLLTRYASPEMAAHKARAQLKLYCMQYSARYRGWHPSDSPSDLHDALSLALVGSVLADDDLERHAGEVLRGAVDRLLLAQAPRKRLLFTVMLAELGFVDFAELKIPDDAFVSPENHLFAQLALSGARMIYHHATGRDVRGEDVEIVLAHQGRDGGWEHHILATLVILIALRRACIAKDAVELGLAFVLRQIRHDGGVPFIPDEDTWVTILTGFVLGKIDPTHALLPSIAEYVASQQLETGGWAYTETARLDDVDDTAVATAFLAGHAPLRYASVLACAHQRLAEWQRLDGGVSTFVRGASSEVEITAKWVTAMLHHRPTPIHAISRALHWIRAARSSEGSFRPEWKLSCMYPMAHVAQALRAASSTPRLDVHPDLRPNLLSYLERHQNWDGGWGAVAGSHVSDVSSSAYALIALSACEGNPDAIKRGCIYVMGAQRPSGEFNVVGDSMGPRPLLNDIKALGSVYAAWALWEASVALDTSSRSVRSPLGAGLLSEGKP
jgi:squalene-hopene/tetraprenyl-beta-curcumene cyclase